MLPVLDLFSGIGGFSLGLERTGGFKTVAFCEIEEFPRRVLAKHWPGVPIYNDVRTLTAERLAADGIAVDVICGGFPCQDVSYAGGGAGLQGERSGLVHHVFRLVGGLGPRVVVLENVSALLSRGLAEVLGALAALGYDAEWHCIPAPYAGAAHTRDRVWIIAYPAALRWAPLLLNELVPEASAAGQLARMGAEEIREWPPGAVICRAADAVPHRLDRVAALGNAVVPQIPELIGRAILASISEQRAAA